METSEKVALYSVLLRLIDDGTELTPLERRDLINTVIHACSGMTADEILSATENNRKLRIKRGTTAQNDTYTGLSGELTLDTDTNTLRVHDGETLGGHVVSGGGAELPENIDYVIEWQTPSATNNYTWYRKYASGWVEQGGHAVASDNSTPSIVTLPVAMSDANYTLTVSIRRDSTTSPGALCVYEAIGSRTANSFGCIGQWANEDSAGRTAYKYNWIVAGFAA